VEELRRFLSKPLGWVVFQIVLLFVVIAGARLAAELFGQDVLLVALIVLAVAASVVSYLIRRRFIGGWTWGDEGDQADRRRPPGA
jgi:hypothetical protein